MCLRRGARNKPGVTLRYILTVALEFTIADDSECTMQATKAWAEANPLEPCECGVVDGTIVIIVCTAGFLISRSRKLEAVASPAQRSQHR